MINAAIVGLGWWGQTLVESVANSSQKIRFSTAVSRSASQKAKDFSQFHKIPQISIKFGKNGGI